MSMLSATRKAHCLGETIEYMTAGDGPATVVLVNGSGGPIMGWHKIFGELASVARVFAYNRPGIGGSSGPAVPQTGTHLVASLRCVLREAGYAPPYVLVGHSFGGLIVNLFAREHPHEVAAVVMLEASTMEDIEVLPVLETKLQRAVAKLANRLFPPDPLSETQHVQETANRLRAAPAFPPVPLLVMAGGKPAMAWATAPEALAARARHQQTLSALSPAGRLIVADKSGHFPQFSQPDLVVATVAEAITLSAVPPGALAPA